MRSAITKVIEKAKIQENEISVAFAGDLVNQIVPTHYTFRETNIPFFGIYGACSTSMESLMLSALMVDSDNAKIALAATSSHNSSAERQYRNPTEYGGPKPETAQPKQTMRQATIWKSVQREGRALRLRSLDFPVGQMQTGSVLKTLSGMERRLLAWRI